MNRETGSGHQEGTDPSQFFSPIWTRENGQGLSLHGYPVTFSQNAPEPAKRNHHGRNTNLVWLFR